MRADGSDSGSCVKLATDLVIETNFARFLLCSCLRWHFPPFLFTMNLQLTRRDFKTDLDSTSSATLAADLVIEKIFY